MFARIQIRHATCDQVESKINKLRDNKDNRNREKKGHGYKTGPMFVEGSGLHIEDDAGENEDTPCNHKTKGNEPKNFMGKEGSDKKSVSP